MRALKRSLGKEAFAAAWNQGRRLDWPQTVALATAMTE